MLDYDEIRNIQNVYKNQKNVMAYIRKKKSTLKNSPDAILFSYDLQSGKNYSHRLEKRKERVWDSIGETINNIISEYKTKNVLEAGMGEGNTLVHATSKNKINSKFFGFDISLSRLLYAKRYLEKSKIKNTTLFTADIGNVPLSDNSMDMVYTSFALEPNYGRERALLQELFRITSKYLVLIEPSYELGSSKTRKHIEVHGYVRNIPKIIKNLGHNILKHELITSFKSSNQASLIVVEKNSENKKSRNQKFVSPISGEKLYNCKNYWYCKKDGHIFPIINGISCLIKENGILCSKISSFR